MNQYPKLRLKPGKERSLQRMHPWIFSGALANDIKETSEGDIVNVTDINGQYLATGYVQHGSIAVRVLSFNDEQIDAGFWARHLQNAYDVRKAIGLADSIQTNCYRLVHGEGDNLPGLIIDIYNDTAVVQCHTSGIYQHLQDISSALQTVYGERLKAVYNKSNQALHGAVSEAMDGFVYGQKESGIVLENGHRFKIDWEAGQKTGFFLDQRDNRALLGAYARGKKVLNTFAYTGGFSVYALMNGAKLVHSVDVSKQAIELLNENMKLNDHDAGKHQAWAADTFDFFKTTSELYDIIVLDPPAFAKSLSARHNAIMGYKRLAIEGLKKLEQGGLLFTFSCSQVVDSQTFYQTMMAACIETGRSTRVLHRMTQGADHPVNIFHPEGEYLKGLVLRVE